MLRELDTKIYEEYHKPRGYMTSREWTENARGSKEPDNYEFSKIWDAVRDWQDSRQWN